MGSYELERFLNIPINDYNAALREVRAGRKVTHWMWYFFPQMRGLGQSYTANRYSLDGVGEARAFLEHPILRSRIIEISESLLMLSTNDPVEIFGELDDMKLRSSMTIFSLAVGDDSVFDKVLEKYFNGERDIRTLQLAIEKM